MIRIEHIYKSFGEKAVLEDITSTFYRGKTNLIIGRSGAGKTVLLKIMVGLLRPDRGRIFYDEVDFLALKRGALRKLRMQIGMLFQGGALFDSWTVEENIRFPLDMFTPMTMGEKRKRVREVLEKVELDDVLHKYPSELSGGMQKRVATLIIDQLISEITRKYDITTVINTHDMNSVMQIGDTDRMAGIKR